VPRTKNAEDSAEEVEVTCVYLVHFGPYVKIGITNNIDRRHAMLQHGVPEDLAMPLVIAFPQRQMAADLEKRIHAHLAPYRTRGEWFRIDHEDAVDKIRAFTAHPVSVSMSWGDALALAGGPEDAIRAALKPISDYYDSVEDPCERALREWKEGRDQERRLN
jgi:hypothetical protein